jgi:hypothetical protein
MRYLSRLGWMLVPVVFWALAGCSSTSNGNSPGDPFAIGDAGNPPPGSGSAAGYSLALSPSKTSTLTNEESIVTATLKDSSDRPVANQLVHFSISAGPAVAVTSSVRTDSNGVALAFVKTGATDVTTNVIVQGSATVQEASVVGYGSFQVSPGNADLISTKLSLSVPSFTVPPNEELVVTATAKDSLGNPLANQAVRFSVTALPAVMLTDRATTDSHGVATAIVRAGNPAGVANVIVQAETTVNSNQVTAVIPFQIVPAAGSSSNAYQMTLTPGKQTVASNEEFAVTARLRDAAGNPVANQALNFAVAAGDAVVLNASASTDSTGTAITRFQALPPAFNSTVILQVSGTVNGTLVTALGTVTVITQAYQASPRRLALESDKSSVGINSDVLLTATLTDEQAQPLPVQQQTVTFSVVAGPGTVIDATVPTDSGGKAVSRLRTGSVSSSSSIIVKASSTVYGVTVNAYSTINLVRQNSYVINFLTSKASTDPDGNLNVLSATISARASGPWTFKQLVPFQVLDNNGVPLPGVDVTIEVFNYGRDEDTVIELVPPWPLAPRVFPPDQTRVTMRTDDHGTGIFTVNVTLEAPGPGLSNAESITYGANATITPTAENHLPAELNLLSYGGFLVQLKQKDLNEL